MEVRFPSKNMYPWQPPVIAFSSTHPDFQAAKCSERDEAAGGGVDGALAKREPRSVFSFVSILEEEEEMKTLLDGKPLSFQTRRLPARTKLVDEPF